MAKVDPTRFPKYNRWLEDSSNATWLESLLRSPQGDLLIDVLKELAAPNQTIENLGASDGQRLQTKLAFMQCITSGQLRTIENLLGLMFSEEESVELNSEGWSGASLERKMREQSP